MANEQNLTPFTSEQNREEAVKNGRKGGINSGKSRKRKSDLRKLAQQVLDGTYTDKKGVRLTGEGLFMSGLVQNLSQPNSKNWGKAMDIMVQLMGANMTNEQKAKLKAETALIKAKVKETENAAANITETASDNFLDALNSTAEDVWNGENDETETETDSDV